MSLTDVHLAATERRIRRLFVLSWLFCIGLLFLVLADYIGWVNFRAVALLCYLALVQWALVVMAYVFLKLVHLAKRIEDDFAHQSVVDGLTGVYNYRYLRQRTKEENDRVQRYGRRAAVLFLDLDHFKEVNDRFGHRAGDETLCDLANTMKGCIRAVDIIGRVGGDEFVVFLPETGGAQAQVLAERLLKRVRGFRKELAGRGVVDFVRVSIGLAVYPENGDSMWAVLTAADNAVYKAKELGGDTVYASQEFLRGEGTSMSVLDRTPAEHENDSGKAGDK